MVYLFRAQEAAGLRADASFRREDDLTVRTERLLDAIDDTTAVVAFSHVLFRTSYIMDAAAIASARARGRRDGDSRHLSVRRHRPGRRHRARRRLRGRRLPEVAVRRAGQRVSLHATRTAQAVEADVHRVGVASKSVRVRHETNKTLLAKIALRPKALWFGAWISNSAIAATHSHYIANAQAGNPNALVQMTVFRMVPWEGDACRRLPTAAEQASYKQWVDRMAGAIGSAHVALVLQPDAPFACACLAGP